MTKAELKALAAHTAYSRGRQSGIADQERTAREAMQAMDLARDQMMDENERFTDLLDKAEQERDQLKAENAELRCGQHVIEAIATMPADQIRDTYNWAYYAPREIGSDAEHIRAGMPAVLRKAMTKEQP